MITAILLAVAAALGVVGAGVSSGVQAKATKDTVDATNKARKEEADLAYQRSLPVNKVAELVDAGMTEQQARQTVAGQGSQSVYAPADMLATSPLDGINAGAPIQALASFLPQLASFYGDSMSSESGGILGSEAIAPVSRIITEHLDELPLSASTSLSGFLRFARSSNAPDWIKSEDFTEIFDKAITNSYGIRALQNFFKNSTTLEIGSKEAEAKVIDVKSKTLTTRLQAIQIDDAAVNFSRNELKWIYDQENIPAASAVDLQLFKNQLEQALMDNHFLTDPEYKTAYLKAMLIDKQNQVLLADIVKKLNTQRSGYLDTESNAYFHAILSTFNQSGITGEFIGNVVAVAEAGGIPIIDTLRQVVAEFKAVVPADPVGVVKNTLQDTVEGVQETANGVAEAVANFVHDDVPAAVNQTGIFLGKSADKFMSFHDIGYSGLMLPNDALMYTLSGGSEKYSERLSRHYENVVKPSLNYRRRQQRRK